MIDLYRKSKKTFKKLIKANPECTQEDWDAYAHENCLYSAFTLKAHFIKENTYKKLIEENEDTFEFLKRSFL